MPAWTKAARLAPRDPLVRRARELLPPPDAASEALLTMGVATAGEWALAAGFCWIALWTAVAARRRRSLVLARAFVSAAAVGLAGRAGMRRGPGRARRLKPASPVAA